MSIYSDKLAHVQVIINCQYSVAQMCTHEDTLAHDLGAPCLDAVMSNNSLTSHNTCNYFNFRSFTKDVVKKIDASSGFERIAQKKESMGICFIGKRKNGFSDFIQVHYYFVAAIQWI